MTELSFNLLREPWIPVSRAGMGRTEVSLLDALVQARDLDAVVHESPLVVASIQRLLLAILHRCLGPPSYDAWSEIWKDGEGTFDRPEVREYLAKWEHRFDLFDSQRPFYQSTDLDGATSDTIALLDLAATAGNNTTLFDHAVDAAPRAMRPAEAALHVIAYQNYTAGGRIKNEKDSFTGGLLRNGVVMLALGRTLFESLTLSLIRYDAAEYPIPCSPSDQPAWEALVPQHGAVQPISGWLNLMTRQPRRIRLRPEREAGSQAVVVKFATIAGGAEPADESRRPPEPHNTHRADKKRGVVPIKASERAEWREADVLLEWRANTGIPSKLLTHTKTLVAEYRVSKDLPLRVQLLGAVTEKAKLLSWSSADLPLPRSVLTSADALQEVKEALDSARVHEEALRMALRAGVKRLLSLSDSRDPDKDDVSKRYQAISTEAGYWAALEPAFYGFMNQLDANPDEAAEVWRQTVLRAARDSLNIGVSHFGDDARGLKARVRANDAFNKQISKLNIQP